MRLRLLMVRVPKAGAKRHSRTVAQQSLDWADWTLLITAVPRRQLSLAEALVLLGERWQREWLCKLWKQDGQVDEWRTAPPWRILCESSAKLIGLRLQQWLIVLLAWHESEAV
jgi:hypothetical protein